MAKKATGAKLELANSESISTDRLFLEQLITRQQAAEELSLNPHTLLRAEQAGRLRGYRIGKAVRYRRADLLAWRESCAQPLPTAA